MRVVIVDDEKRTRELISKMIESLQLDIEVVGEGESVDTGVRLIESQQPDLVLLDIQLSDGNGFDIIKALSHRNFQVIFITAHEEYAIKAIKFSALDYVLKPIDVNELRGALTRALASQETQSTEKQYDALQHNTSGLPKKRLVLKTAESVFVMDLDDIIRCESERNYTRFFFTSGNRVLVSKTLKEYETILSGGQFMRISQSHIINLAHVDRYDKIDGGSVVMKDNSHIPLSPTKKELFFQLLEKL